MPQGGAYRQHVAQPLLDGRGNPARSANCAIAPSSANEYSERMVDELQNLVLVYLRRIDRNVAQLQEDVRDIKGRLTSVEERLAALETSVAHVHGDFAGQ